MFCQIKFGTDGWRALIAEDFTFDNVRLCAQAVANYLKDKGTASRGLVVGYDTRFASEHFAQAVAEVMAANGIITYLCQEPAPTPAISYGILAQKAAGAAIITASHNAALWSGFKYKPEYAGSASPQVIAELESRIAQIRASGREVPRLSLGEGQRRGLIRALDAAPPYLARLATLVNLEALRGAGLRIVADAMYGAGAGYFRRLLAGGQTKVLSLHQERHPLFPGLERPEPIGENLGELMRRVARQGAHIGLATDGDADRLGVVDEKGRYVNQLVVFGLLALYLLEVRGWRGGLVKALSTTSMIDKLGELYQVPVYETPVGFKYIGPKMLEEDAIIGGEESGGYGFKGHIPERDGILAALFLLDFMVRRGQALSELVAHLFAKVGPHHYHRLDLSFAPEQREDIVGRLQDNPPQEIEGARVIRIQTEDGFKYTLADGSWLLIRFSGTEPVVRIYTETDSPQRVERLLERGRELVGL